MRRILDMAVTEMGRRSIKSLSRRPLRSLAKTLCQLGRNENTRPRPLLPTHAYTRPLN